MSRGRPASQKARLTRIDMRRWSTCLCFTEMRRVCLKTHSQVANNRVNSCAKDRKHFSHPLARCHVSVILPACLFISLIVILSIPRLLYLMSELTCLVKVKTDSVSSLRGHVQNEYGCMYMYIQQMETHILC